MCHSSIDKRRSAGVAVLRGGLPASGLWLALALVFMFSAFACVLSAANTSDEYLLLQNYVLPETAVPTDSLEQNGDLWLSAGAPFTGLAYETFNNGHLSRVLSLTAGLQDGPTYLWYPTGAPQMSASYRGGRLNGRFLGWYLHGGVIYDMVINGQGYAGDYVEDDGARGQDGGGGDEPDADGQNAEPD